eukprot:9326610-Alexandrium_andersonii.AAC.1
MRLRGGSSASSGTAGPSSFSEGWASPQSSGQRRLLRTKATTLSPPFSPRPVRSWSWRKSVCARAS